MEVFGLPTSLFTGGGAVALLAAVTWLIFTGRLVPRSAIDDIRADRDYWREAHRLVTEANGEKIAQNTAVLNELTHTQDQFFNSLLPAEGTQRRPRGTRQ